MKIVFDIGSTKTRVAKVVGADIGPIERMPTPQKPEEGIETLAALVAKVGGGEKVEAAVGAIPGTPNTDGSILFLPHRPLWDGFPFSAQLSKSLSADVRVEHDANLGALGEALYGAGKGVHSLAYLAVGTGLGVARVVEGAIVSPVTGFEAGHQIVDISRGIGVDETVGGDGILKKYAVRAEELPRETYDELTKIFAVGIYNTILHWLPDVVVLGGSLMNEENGYRLADITAAIRSLPPLIAKFPDIRRGTLGDAANLHGARALIEQPLV